MFSDEKGSSGSNRPELFLCAYLQHSAPLPLPSTISLLEISKSCSCFVQVSLKPFYLIAASGSAGELHRGSLRFTDNEPNIRIAASTLGDQVTAQLTRNALMYR